MRPRGPWARYLANGSVIENLDPRVKVASFFVLLVVLALAARPPVLLVAALARALALRLARIGGAYLASRLRPFLPVVLFTFLVNLLFTPGPSLFGWAPPWGGLSVPGALQGLVRTAQLLLMLSLVVLALSASTPLELVEGVEALCSGVPPLRRRARDLATPILIAFRFLPVLLDEADGIRKAQRMRGALRGSGFRDRVRAAFAVLTPVFLAALRRGEALALALEARGYGVSTSPSPAATRALGPADRAAILAVLAALARAIGLRLAR